MSDIKVNVMPDAEHLSLFHILMEGQCVVECGTYTPEGVNEAGDWYPETLLLPEPLTPYEP